MVYIMKPIVATTQIMLELSNCKKLCMIKNIVFKETLAAVT